MTKYYISITGFTLKSNLYMPKFMMYSIPAARQAAAAEGNVFSEQSYIDGVLHTLSAWESKADMRRYMLRGAHAKAMKLTQEIGNLDYGTKTYGYESNRIPTWDEAIAIWHEKATLHGRAMPSKAPTTVKTTSNNNTTKGGIGKSSLLVPILISALACVALRIAQQSILS